MQPSEIYSIAEIAKLLSGVAGILAGFALTIVILLIDRRLGAATREDSDSAAARGAAAVFITAFFTGIAAAFLLAHAGGSLTDSPRAYLLCMPAIFTFALATLLLFYGLVLLLATVVHGDGLSYGRILLFGATMLTSGNVIYVGSDAIAMSRGLSTVRVYTDPATAVPLLLAGTALPLLALLAMAVRGRRTVGSPILLQQFVLASTVLALVASLSIAPISVLASADATPSLWLILPYVAAFSALVAATILLNPLSRSGPRSVVTRVS